MHLKLKPGAVLVRDHNHLGLTLDQWQALEAGQTLEVQEPITALLAVVDIQDEELTDGR